MSDSVVWMLVFFLAYFAYCIFMGVRASRRTVDPQSFFSPVGGIRTWVFVIAATSATFAGWNFTGHPAGMFRDGFQYSNASFFVILVPLGGILVMRRQWLLGRKYGVVTPGEMYSRYFGSDSIAIISAGVAVVFAVPFLATLFSASGSLLQGLSGGAISRELGMWGLASVVLLYCVTGGIGAVAQVGVVQGVLFIAGMIVLGALAVAYAGGLMGLSQGLAALAAAPETAGTTSQGFGGGDYNGLFVVPGVIQWTAGLGVSSPLGGPWTAVMGLTFALSLMGLQFAPGFSVWSYASSSPRAFSIHQIWGSAFCVGVALFLFSPLQGMAAHLLGADSAANGANIAKSRILPQLRSDQIGDLVMNYIKLLATEEPWLMGLLAVAAVAALQSTAAAYLVTSGNILSRDLYKRHIDKNANWRQQRVMSGVAMLLLCLSALTMASFAMPAVLVLATLAIPFGFQFLPALVAVLWLPWVIPRAVAFGLVAGLFAVVLTEPLGQSLTGDALPWGRWPWTIHSGVWGMFFNICVCLITAFFSRSDPDRQRREDFHKVYKTSASPPVQSARMISAAWIILLVWLFFGPGPGSVLGNSLFGRPGDGIQAWVFGVPSIWAWQVFWWIMGVGLVWFLSERMQLSTSTGHEPAQMMNGELEGVSNDR